MFIDRSPYASSHRCKNNVWISYGCKYLYMLTQSLHPHMRLRYFVCSAMKLDITWAALAGIDKAGFLDPDPIHICTTWMMFNCHHAIQNSLRSLLMHAEFITIFLNSIARLASWVDTSQSIPCADSRQRTWRRDNICACSQNRNDPTKGSIMWEFLNWRKLFFFMINWMKCQPQDIMKLVALLLAATTPSTAITVKQHEPTKWGSWSKSADPVKDTWSKSDPCISMRLHGSSGDAIFNFDRSLLLTAGNLRRLLIDGS